jgi:hypothetical protein
LKIKDVPGFLFQRERFYGGNRKKYCRISRISNTETAPLGQKDRVYDFSNKPYESSKTFIRFDDERCDNYAPGSRLVERGNKKYALFHSAGRQRENQREGPLSLTRFKRGDTSFEPGGAGVPAPPCLKNR